MAEDKFRNAISIEIPVIVIGEYRFGILQSRNRLAYERFLEASLRSCRVLAVDQVTAEHYAGLRLELKRVGTRLPINDIWIAALCRQHERPLLSRDVHFDSVSGLQRLAW